MANAPIKEVDIQFLQTLVPPEEDRAKYTTAPWTGGYRWFRSPNVICLEQYRPGISFRRPRP